VCNAINPIDMKHLFSPEGQAALVATMARKPLLAFDFDGTLAPIVSRPDDARMSPAVSRRLSQLARSLPVAIVSGRSVVDVTARLEFQPHYIVGSHGAEDPSAGAAPSWVELLDEVRVQILAFEAELAAAGVEVEDKLFSIAFHYRRAPDPEAALALITRLLAHTDRRLAIFGGKMVANVVAAQAPDKADAVASLVARSGASCAVFAGDDLNDEPVFARPEPLWLTVRVGRTYPNSQAKFFVDDSSEVEIMLERMLAALGGN
jgi:trehalose 6-phosphate phosphatase